ncbi:Piwi-domain-containing protein [Rhizophagus irregularis]|uniref:Piwi-domain-containing protein n=1 Tax=Rhizophagus irregularis TaxID=588596 RepID=A0A2N0S9H2_9GLOM|nr:Piwi-domain-containing protein [Rhizophagus irregularis]
MLKRRIHYDYETIISNSDSKDEIELPKKQKAVDFKLTSTELKVAERPDVGLRGKSVDLKCNYLKINTLPNVDIHHYKFSVRPCIKKPKALFKIFSRMCLDNVFGPVHPVFDGKEAIYSPSHLNINAINEDGEIYVNMDQVALPRDEKHEEIRTYNARIEKVQIINFRLLQDYINGQSPLTGEILNCNHVLNIIMNFTAHNMFIVDMASEDWSDHMAKNRVPGANQGFCQSMRPGWENMVINVDFHDPNLKIPAESLINVVAKILNKTDEELLSKTLSEDEIKKLERTLTGLQIRIVHRGNPKTKYIIDGLSKELTKDIKFRDDKGFLVKAVDFFPREFQWPLRYTLLPCLIVKKKLFMPMDVCEVMPGQKWEFHPEDDSMLGMIKISTENQARFQHVESRVKNILKFFNTENIKELGMDIDNRMMTVNGRVLNPPIITCDEGGQQTEVQTEKGRWTFENQVVKIGKPLENWSLVILCGERHNRFDSIQEFLNQLCNMLNEIGLNVITVPEVMYANKQGNIEQALAIAYQKAHINKKISPQLIVCIMPTHSKQLYSEIKRVSDTVLGIPTQCITADKVTFKWNKQLLANIGLKINAKLGGHNWSLSKSDLSLITEVPTMLLGADISHPNVLTKVKRSITGMCGSMDLSATTYIGRSSVQKETHNPTIEVLEELVSELLFNYKERNKVLPQRILYYRAGLTPSQFRGTLNAEIISLKAAFTKTYEKNMPKLTFIIAEKSNHTRFLPDNPQDADRFGNCQPGTVVDKGIVFEKEFDFYLQSHPGINSKARPTHYHVLYDENNFNSDLIQSLTYHLCYLSATCTHAISFVPPIAYARNIAERARMYATAANTDLISQFEAMDIDDEIETKDNENQSFIEIENGSNKEPDYLFPSVSRSLLEWRRDELLGIRTLPASNSTLAERAICPGGFIDCLNGGCCPRGSKCIADNKCSIRCTPGAPLCNGGCCLFGQVCGGKFCVAGTKPKAPKPPPPAEKKAPPPPPKEKKAPPPPPKEEKAPPPPPKEEKAPPPPPKEVKAPSPLPKEPQPKKQDLPSAPPPPPLPSFSPAPPPPSSPPSPP